MSSLCVSQGNQPQRMGMIDLVYTIYRLHVVDLHCRTYSVVLSWVGFACLCTLPLFVLSVCLCLSVYVIVFVVTVSVRH